MNKLKDVFKFMDIIYVGERAESLTTYVTASDSDTWANLKIQNGLGPTWVTLVPNQGTVRGLCKKSSV